MIDKLAAALEKAQDDAVIQQRLSDLGGTVPAKRDRAPTKFASFVKSEIDRWSPILKAANAEAK